MQWFRPRRNVGHCPVDSESGAGALNRRPANSVIRGVESTTLVAAVLYDLPESRIISNF